MMSPDPPREERQDESEDTTRIPDDPIGIQAAWIDMDDTDELMFVPEGPHEMDMGGSESEYSSDDDDNNESNHPLPRLRDNTESEADHPQEAREGGQARGYYQLLIPFPAPEQSASSDDLESTQGQFTQSSRGQHQPSNSPSAVAATSIDTTSHGSTTDSKPAELTQSEITKREIDLTEDKLETIKSVMKGFVLPQASIPGWATEVEEDVWKKRLFDAFDTKTSPESSRK